MFEKYTEKAPRVIFFARYESSQFGSPYIETEHRIVDRGGTRSLRQSESRNTEIDPQEAKEKKIALTGFSDFKGDALIAQCGFHVR
jgi:hypothetical protein